MYRFYLQLSRRRTYLSNLVVYAVFIIAAFFVANSRLQGERAAKEETQFTVNTDPAPVETGPFFSLSTNRTFGTSENPHLWLDHRGIESLDFRVYRINDPQRFFAARQRRGSVLAFQA